MATPEEREARETRSGTEPFFFPSQDRFPQFSFRDIKPDDIALSGRS
jgi:hypothetical protein